MLMDVFLYMYIYVVVYQGSNVETSVKKIQRKLDEKVQYISSTAVKDKLIFSATI